MSVLLIILAAAAASMGLARRLKLPLAPLLILSGVVVSALGLVNDPDLFQEALFMGLAFLVFSAGTEMNPARVGRQGKAAVSVGLAQLLALALIGGGLAWLLGFGWLEALYLALALAASSTLVVIGLLKQRQQLFEPFGRLVVGVLLVQDLVIILAIAALSHIEEGATAVFISINGTLGLILLARLSLQWLSPWLLLRLGLDEEEKLLAALAILFLFIGAANLIGVPLVIGAFLAGIALSVFPVSGILRGQLSSLSDFFLAIFFVTLGSSLTLPTWSNLLLALLLAAVVILVTPPLVYLIARRAGLTARSGWEGGLLLAQTSEFSLIVGLIGVQQGHVGQQLLSIIAMVTVLTMIATPLLATDRNSVRLLHRLTRRKAPAAPFPPADHVLLLGCGEHGLALLERLQARGTRVVVVDEDAAVAARVAQMGVTALQGAAADPRVLAAAGAAQARVIVSTLRRMVDNEAVLRQAGATPVLVAVFAPEAAAQVEALGGTAVAESHVAAEAFMDWFAAREGQAPGRPPA